MYITRSMIGTFYLPALSLNASKPIELSPEAFWLALIDWSKLLSNSYQGHQINFKAENYAPRILETYWNNSVERHSKPLPKLTHSVKYKAHEMLCLCIPRQSCVDLYVSLPSFSWPGWRNICIVVNSKVGSNPGSKQEKCRSGTGSLEGTIYISSQNGVHGRTKCTK